MRDQGYGERRFGLDKPAREAQAVRCTMRPTPPLGSLDGPSRTIRVEPVETPVPAPPPRVVPEREPAPDRPPAPAKPREPAR
jgi:hypothetical protein